MWIVLSVVGRAGGHRNAQASGRPPGDSGKVHQIVVMANKPAHGDTSVGITEFTARTRNE
jgi:hypothetical protein